MNLYDLLRLKFPEAVFGLDIILRDDSDGKGPYIHEWNMLCQKPTQDDLDLWAEDLQQTLQFEQNKIANQLIYEQLEIIDKKSIRALRENDTQRLADLETSAAYLREQLLPVSYAD